MKAHVLTSSCSQKLPKIFLCGLPMSSLKYESPVRLPSRSTELMIAARQHQDSP
jgi:hypothetical protein